MEQKNNIQKPKWEKVLLVGVDTGEEEDFEACMKELESLAEACMMETAGIITQNMETVHKSLYVGTGKVAEISHAAAALEIDVVIFYDSLSPSQLRNLQKEIGKPVLDRTSLILDIFERRAVSREARLQVETAKLQYLLPRLTGMHEALTRQGGTSGSMSSRGAGEKKLELDRRRISHRITELKRELKEVSRDREVQRRKRMSARIPLVSLVGYTNAGKSTIMNALIETYGKEENKKVLEQDMLFATLDTAVRRIETGNNRDFLLSDTVGFLHKLPPGLIKAFHSTLEEIQNADLLLHVVDCSDEHHKEHIKVTQETLKELEASHIPVITVFNKADKCMTKLPIIRQENQITMSAKQRIGLNELIEMIISKIHSDYIETKFLIPYCEGSVVSYFMDNAVIKSKEYLEEGIAISVRCHKADRDKYSWFEIPAGPTHRTR